MPEITELISNMKTDLVEKIGGFKTGLDGLKSDFSNMQKQLDAIDQRQQRPRDYDGKVTGSVDSVVKAITDSPSFQELKSSGSGRAIVRCPNPLETKTITSSGLTTAQGIGPIADSGRPMAGGVRRMMRTLPMTTGSVFFVQETSHAGINASPQVEASAKNESTFNLTGASVPAEVIATWSAISKQAMDDQTSLSEFIRGTLIWGLESELESGIIGGSGVSPNLVGLTTDAQNFDTSLLSGIASGGYNRADCLRAAALQLILDGYGCTGFVVNPVDWFLIEVTKTTTREYVMGDPRRQLDEILWSRPIVPSLAISSGHFLAGDFDSGAHLRMRQDMVIDISDQHSDFFVKNLLAVRAECRFANVVMKPESFVYGAFASSPA